MAPLPYLCIAVLESRTADSDKRVIIIVAMNRRNIISFGDSVMKGIVTGKDITEKGRERYVISDSSFASLCARRMGVTIENYGRFGNTVTGGVRDVARHARQIEDARLAFLEFGGNDCNYDWNAIAEKPGDEHSPQTTLSAFRSTYVTLISRVREFGCIPVMLSLPPIDSVKFYSYICTGFCAEKCSNVLKWLGGSVNTIGNWHEMYNLELYRIAAEEGVRLIDITTCFLSRRDFSSLFCDDGMHPNETGHSLISDAICASMPQLAI